MVKLQGFFWSNAELQDEVYACPFCKRDDKVALVESDDKDIGLYAIACGNCGGIGPDSADGPSSAAAWWNGELQ